MKTLLALLLITSSAFAAQAPAAISFGGGDVVSGGLESSKGLSLKKRDGDVISLSCRGGFLGKKTLRLELANGIVAEGKIDHCKNLLSRMYEGAFEKNVRYTLALSDAPNAKGVYGLKVGTAYSVEIAQ